MVSEEDITCPAISEVKWDQEHECEIDKKGIHSINTSLLYINFSHTFSHVLINITLL